MNRLLIVACLLLGLSVALIGCDNTKDTAAASPQRDPDATYTVRGVIDTLPTPGTTAFLPRIKHEPIPDFKNAAGETVGMAAMAMEFPPAKDVSLDGFAVGDKVELTFSVWWEGRSGKWLMTRLTKLPADTELHFPAPAATESDSPDGEHADHDHSGHDHDHCTRSARVVGGAGAARPALTSWCIADRSPRKRKPSERRLAVAGCGGFVKERSSSLSRPLNVTVPLPLTLLKTRTESSGVLSHARTKTSRSIIHQKPS